MVGIFSAAGVFKGGFCHHFASKEALFFGRLSQLVQLFQIALLEIATDNTKPTKDRLIDTIASEGQFLSQSTIGP